MKKIYEDNKTYSLLKYYVDYCTKTSYRETSVCGQENIPDDGAVIIAPNHCNTLMDALVVLRAHHGATVFGARADLFKKYAKPLTFLRIVPMVRKRDGIREVAKNQETNEKLMEVLENEVPFCIFSEGTHRPKRSLLPISKGIARIALSANEKFGHKKPVYIVPTGIEYGDYFRYRSTSLLQYGKPINVTEFVKENADLNESQLQMALREKVREGIANLITYIPDDEEYDKKWSLARILAAGRSGGLRRKLRINQKAIARIEELYKEKPSIMEELSSDAIKLHSKRKDAGISILSFDNRPLALSLAWKSIVAILGLPVFLFFIVTCCPVWIFSESIRRKIKDKAFHNTVHFASKLIFTPLVMIIWAAVFFCTLPSAISHSGAGFLMPALSWIIPSVLTVSVLFGQNFIYDYSEFMRIYASDWKLTGKPELLKEFRRIRKVLKNL